jgi:hypothetical protein
VRGATLDSDRSTARVLAFWQFIRPLPTQSRGGGVALVLFFRYGSSRVLNPKSAVGVLSLGGMLVAQGFGTEQ